MCEHSHQTYHFPRGWFCAKCGVEIPRTPPVDWSDGRVPFIIDDMPEHFNLSAGTVLRSRAHVRALGLEPVPPVSTSTDPDQRKADALSAYEAAETRRWEATRASIPPLGRTLLADTKISLSQAPPEVE